VTPGIILSICVAAAGAAPARAATAEPAAAKPARSTFKLKVDPRIELLGVVQYLAGLHQAVPGEDLDAVEKRFAAFRSHAAVKTYAATVARLGGSNEPYGVISLLMTDPPELKWSRDVSLLSGDFIEKAGGMPKLEEFIAQLRDFAKASDFAGYYAEDRAVIEKSARAETDQHDYIAALEAYEGRGLNSRVSFVLCRLYSRLAFASYIVPYPFQGPGRPPRTGPFDVFTLLAPQRLTAGDISYGLGEPMQRGLWNELIYVMIEPGMAASDGVIQSYRNLHKAAGPECFDEWNHCAEHLIMQAVSSRIEIKMFKDEPSWPDGKMGEFERALSARLVEYETHRKRYPTLLDFFPRLVETFGEMSAKPTPASEAAPRRQNDPAPESSGAGGGR
jgi:hypothetical protein